MNAYRIAVTVLAALLPIACGEPTPEGHPPAESGPRRLVIRMLDDMTFEPANPAISVGDTVVWINAGKLPHTTTADPDLVRTPANVVLPEGASRWDSGVVLENEEYRVVFTVPGRYAYVCTLHEIAGMVGSLEVRP
jgi:plastocyanin